MKCQPRLILIDGVEYEPEAPILLHRDEYGEIWVKAKEHKGYWSRTNRERKQETTK